MSESPERAVVVFSLTSDIGLHVALRYRERGFKVYGTYKSSSGKEQILNSIPDAKLYYCDANSFSSVDEAVQLISNDINAWDILISCPCIPEPLKPFFESDIDEWTSSFSLNSLAQLRFMHRIRNKARINTNNDPMVVFFAGGGTNNAVINFSAYTSAKIHLIKMFELLAAEDASCKYVILGPGWTKTKTHYRTLAATPEDSPKHKEVLEFMSRENVGTPLDDIYFCIDWMDRQKILHVSGRNFSIVYDPWNKNDGKDLIQLLSNDDNMYKLRRSGNNSFATRNEL